MKLEAFKVFSLKELSVSSKAASNSRSPAVVTMLRAESPIVANKDIITPMVIY
jgi:hypothetical protein